MFSGLVLTKYSGRLMGTHQKLDRIARRHFRELAPHAAFPSTKDILEFEGTNGPDGIKRKSPSHNEPWHFLDPLNDTNHEFTKIIDTHYKHLVKELKRGNRERSSFEAAWLAHAIVDGLTPAHHFPYEEKVNELRGGGNSTRNTVSEKLLFKGPTPSKTLANTFKVYGPKGLLTAHIHFEWGVMFIIRPLRLPDARPTKKDLKEAATHGASEYFMRRAREIAVMDMFEQYIEKGWTSKLSREVRHELAPTMVKTITVLWYQAAKEAGICA